MKPSIDSPNAHRSPACFGSPSCFAGDSKACQSCVGYSECGEAVKETLIRIRGVTDIEDLLHRHKQALEKARKKNAEKELSNPKSDLVKPPRPMPKQIQRTSKVEKITYEINEETKELIGHLPVKAQPFAIRLCEDGMIDKIKDGLKTKTNPMKGGAKFLYLAVSMLIEGGFSKSELKNKYIETLGWSENTASSHVSLAVGLFQMFEVTNISNGRVVANPALMSENINNVNELEEV